MWLALRRPLAIAFILGCSMSLMTSGRLTLRLALPATVYWSFVPACELLALAVVFRQRLKPAMIDAYFRSNAFALCWAVAVTVSFGFLPSREVINLGWFLRLWYLLGVAALVWGGYRDFGFFRIALGRTKAEAARELVGQRMVCWILMLAIFVGPAAWQLVASKLGV